MDKLFASAAAQSNFSSLIKLLDVAIEMFDGGSQTQAELHELLLNRGYCNQRLQLNRKALKVRRDGARTPTAPPACLPGLGPTAG